MKSSGTVKKYYPFLKPEIQDILSSLLATSRNYHEFTERLCQLAMEKDSNQILVYMAASHALRLRNYNQISVIEDQYPDADRVRPFLLFARALRGERKAQNQFLSSANQVIETYSEDWVKLDMYDLIQSFYRYVSVTSYEEILGIVRKAEKLVATNDALRCLGSFIYTAKGWANQNLGRISNVVENYGQTLVIARKCDDLLATADALFGLRTSLAGYDYKREMSILQEIQDIFRELNYRIGESFVLDHRAEVFAYLGEFEQARDAYLESITIKESVGLEHPQVLSKMSQLHASIGDADNAIEYSRQAIMSSRLMNAEHPMIYFDMARALLLKDSFDEAYTYLETGGELVFLSGSEAHLGSYYFHRALLESNRGDYDFAIKSFQRSLKVSERTRDFNTVVKSLVRTAEANIVMFSKTMNKDYLTDAEVAVSRVEQIAEEQNFNSLSVEVSILKAEIEIAYKEEERAKAILTNALNTCNAFGFQSLKERVEERLRSLGSEIPHKLLASRFKEPARRISIPSGLSREIPFKVLGCLVIHTKSGLEVFSSIIDQNIVGDAGLIAGLLSAVSLFTTELTKSARGTLQSIVHQDIAVLLEPGKNLTFALLSDRDTYEARMLLRRFMEDFELTYGDFFLDWRGRSVKLDGSDEIFNKILVKREK